MAELRAVLGASRAGAIQVNRSSSLASLEDVAPKVRSLVFGDERHPSAHEISPAFGPRTHVLMETGWAPSGFNILNPNGSAALRIAESSYNVAQDGRIEMKPDVYSAAMNRKSLGITDGRRSLVVTGPQGVPAVVISDINARSWDVFAFAPVADERMDTELLALACDHSEIKARIPAWCKTVDPSEYAPSPNTN